MFEYTLPFREYILDHANSCKLCIEEGRMFGMVGLKVGADIYIDEKNWICCPRCYREQKRLGKVW